MGDVADQISRAMPGHRVEILQGRLTVAPPADGEHAVALSWLMRQFDRAGAWEAGLRFVQGIGVSLPTGPQDYAIPDLSVVDKDFREAGTYANCYAPRAFRLVVEVTSPSNRSDDLGIKAEAYARAGIPVYVVVDRRQDEVLVHTDPRRAKYRSVERYKRGMDVPVPESVGIELSLSADQMLEVD
ncbi:Uma2 family endonuclease [Streptomyces sp. NPDC050560]|uniref:Uma2 family endonuclease n=1 Tax=Streptomyces sp. NPDC050560 TaxID=3365630 RepID=UPI0037A69E22